jgi:hypothetical protein
MKHALYLVSALILSGLWGARAEAQIEAGDIKASIEAGIVRWVKQEDTYSAFGIRSKEKAELTGAGAFLGAGVGAGYAVSKYFIPSLYLSLQNLKNNEGAVDTTLRSWELKPSLEVALLPSLRFVPFADVGLILQRQIFKATDEDGDGGKSSRLALGPALGVGVHLFAVQHASFDLSFNYRAAFKVQNSGDVGLGRLDKSTQHLLLLNLGASLWI